MNRRVLFVVWLAWACPPSTSWLLHSNTSIASGFSRLFCANAQQCNSRGISSVDACRDRVLAATADRDSECSAYFSASPCGVSMLSCACLLQASVTSLSTALTPRPFVNIYQLSATPLSNLTNDTSKGNGDVTTNVPVLTDCPFTFITSGSCEAHNLRTIHSFRDCIFAATCLKPPGFYGPHFAFDNARQVRAPPAGCAWFGRSHSAARYLDLFAEGASPCSGDESQYACFCAASQQKDSSDASMVVAVSVSLGLILVILILLACCFFCFFMKRSPEERKRIRKPKRPATLQVRGFANSSGESTSPRPSRGATECSQPSATGSHWVSDMASEIETPDAERGIFLGKRRAMLMTQSQSTTGDYCKLPSMDGGSTTSPLPAAMKAISMQLSSIETPAVPELPADGACIETLSQNLQRLPYDTLAKFSAEAFSRLKADEQNNLVLEYMGVSATTIKDSLHDVSLLAFPRSAKRAPDRVRSQKYSLKIGSPSVSELSRQTKPKYNFVKFGELVFGDVCGVGSFGEVKCATWKGANVAIKRAHNSSQFIQEVDMLVELSNHPRCCRIFGLTIDPNAPSADLLIVMEYYENGSIRDYFRKTTVELDLKYKFIYQCCSAVSYLHDQGIIHRDLAARNFLIDGKLDVVISDFGLSKWERLDNSSGSSPSFTKRGPIRWMAPESIALQEHSTMSDTWMLGVVIWEILSDCAKPFASDTNSEVFLIVSQGEHLPISDAWAGEAREALALAWCHAPEARCTPTELCHTFEQLHDSMGNFLNAESRGSLRSLKTL